MPKFQDEMKLREQTVQELAEASEALAKIPRLRKERREREHPVDVSVQTRRKSDREASKVLSGVHEGVIEKAMELAEGDWRRLEVVDKTTIIVHNNEVH